MPIFPIMVEVFRMCVDIRYLQVVLAVCHWILLSRFFLTHAGFKIARIYRFAFQCSCCVFLEGVRACKKLKKWHLQLVPPEWSLQSPILIETEEVLCSSVAYPIWT